MRGRGGQTPLAKVNRLTTNKKLIALACTQADGLDYRLIFEA